MLGVLLLLSSSAGQKASGRAFRSKSKKPLRLNPGAFVTDTKCVFRRFRRPSPSHTHTHARHQHFFFFFYVATGQVSPRLLVWSPLAATAASISAEPGSHHCSPAVNHHAAISGPIWAYQPLPLQMILTLIGLTGLLSVGAD